MPTWLLRFDERGACTSPLTRRALLEHLAAGGHTDVILFSHGWNNDFDDALALYGGFLRRFEAAAATHPPARAFVPLFVGVVWPSTWLVFGGGPRIAADGEDDASDAVVGELAARVAASSPDVRIERFYELMERVRLDAREARELAELVAPALPRADDEEAPVEAPPATAADVLAALGALAHAEAGAGAAAPDLDDWGGPPRRADTPQAAGWLDRLDPRNVVRLFSVYQMKDRAGTVGYRGVAPLLREMLRETGGALHAVGHSYGCKVLLSAICEPAPLPRPVDSLLLMQPAVSYLCFAAAVPEARRQGGYRAALDPARVKPPIITTYSKKDFALHETFHLSLRRAADLGEARIAADDATTAGVPPSLYAALGGYGPRGAGQKLVDPLPPAGTPYPPADAPVLGLDGSRGAIGGHGDVKNDATAWALHQLAFR